MKKSKRKNLAVLIWVAAIMALWELAAYNLDAVAHDSMAIKKLPYLHNVFITIGENFNSLFSASAVTFSRAAQGFLIGAIIGFFIAVIMSLHKSMEKMLLPYMIVFQMIPVLALAPIVYSIVKNQDSSRVVLSAFITFFPVAINMFAGLKSVDADKKDLMKSYAARKPTVYLKLMLPYSRTYLFTGLKLAAPSAITAAVLVEMMGSNSGIGFKILSSLYYGNAGAMNFWSSVMMAAFMGIFTYYLIVILEKITAPGFLKLKRKGGKGNGKKTNVQNA